MIKLLKNISLVLTVLSLIISSSGITTVFPFLSVIPDIIDVGANYIYLDIDENSVTEKDLKEFINKACENQRHPFVLSAEENFETARNEYLSGASSEYTKKLSDYVLANADGLLNTEVYPALAYELDEEDSILPISREVFNRIVVLGYAWQITEDSKYAERAWLELENVCSYNDWCESHFLATAEMALAVATGYDWFFDFLNEEQKSLLAETTYNYAIQPALSKNHLKNWFTWSKNNWNSICYSGIGIACMTFCSYYPDEAAEFLSMCYRNMPIAFENFTPDGVYAEGSGYCQSGMNAIAFFVATSRNLFGTDFGMSEIDGFKQLGYFPVYITTPTGVFNFGDNKDRMCFSPVLHWYASEYEAPLLSLYQMWDMPGVFAENTSDSVERNGDGKEDALSSLWYNREYTSEDMNFAEPLSVNLKSDVGQSLTLMRSAYLDSNATFAGIKGGYNYTNHGDLDIGTFVFDSMGERWAEELGPGNYDAPDYFVNLPLGGRWKNYCKRAEGQNTLVINPGLTMEDQYAFAKSDFTCFEETEDGGMCTLDMSDAYCMNMAKKVIRNFELYNNFSSLKITDDIECTVPGEIYWFMHTKAEIEISEDGKIAVLTKNGKHLKATLLSDGAFSLMSAEGLKGSYEYDSKYPDIKKLTVHLSEVKTARIEIILEPMI